MAQVLWLQGFQSLCKPGVTSGGGELSAAIAKYRQQIRAWEVDFQAIDAQVKRGGPATPYCRLLSACKVYNMTDLAGAKPMALMKTLNAYRGTTTVHGRKFEKAEVEAMIDSAKQMREGLEAGS